MIFVHSYSFSVMGRLIQQASRLLLEIWGTCGLLDINISVALFLRHIIVSFFILKVTCYVFANIVLCSVGVCRARKRSDLDGYSGLNTSNVLASNCNKLDSVTQITFSTLYSHVKYLELESFANILI